MDKNHKVSVIIPCYNQAKFIKEACLSVMNQEYKNWEAIIIDDGSTDNSEDVINEIIKLDNRFTYIKKENEGVSSARNVGLKSSNGDYILFLDGDDLITKDKLSSSVEVFNQDKDIDVVISDFKRKKKYKYKKAFCNMKEIDFTYENFLRYWDVKFSFPPHCLVIKKKMVEDCSYNLKFRSKQDWLFWLDVFSKRPKYFYIDKVQAIYRIHKRNVTKNHVFMEKYKLMIFEFIYDSLKSDEHRKLFFDKLNHTLHKSNLELIKYKHDSFFKKVWYAIF